MHSEMAQGVKKGKKLATRTDTALARLLAAQCLQEGTGLLHNDRQVAHVNSKHVEELSYKSSQQLLGQHNNYFVGVVEGALAHVGKGRQVRYVTSAAYSYMLQLQLASYGPHVIIMMELLCTRTSTVHDMTCV